MVKASIVGGSGYAGGEILRILLSHPEVEIAQITSRRFAGQSVTIAHPNLRGKTSHVFSKLSDLKKCDLLFVCLPNTKSMAILKKISKLSEKIIDLGADYRLHSKRDFENWYGMSRENENFSKKFVYGISELHREEIKKTNYVSCAGCEATAINLALYPLSELGIISKKGIIADVKIGSSASGNSPSRSSHHPERHGVLRSYKPTHHRHEAEVKQELGVNVEISATAVNIVRGILATIHTEVKKGVSEKDIWRAYREVYGKEPFIRIVKQKTGLYRYPEPKILWGTNFCDIGFEKNPNSDRLVVMSAIDNLVKGTAGQAVQAMNLMFGFDETLGLEFTGFHPI
jgi:N-acetyl-gamma-glutamyl-phosphate/LysW-gamma-L-alpha-aminoadipyl-6-phosphate reductase